MAKLQRLLLLFMLFSGPAVASYCDDLVEGPPRTVADGFRFVEGPLWHPGGYWVFSDIRANTVYSLVPGGQPRPLLRPSGYANGNALDARGNLILARHDRTLARLGPQGLEILAAAYQGRRLNSPNDVVVAADGAIWFTDPTYGLTGNGPERAPEEQPVRGIYRLDPGGGLKLMNGDLVLPNGLAFSPDGRWLYAGDSANGNVYRFAVKEDASLGPRRFFARLRAPWREKPTVDGLKVDPRGRLWTTGRRAIGVYGPSGLLMCRIDLPVKTVSNLAFGGPDGRELLITAGDRLLSLRIRPGG